jgi:hypothetical protein
MTKLTPAPLAKPKPKDDRPDLDRNDKALVLARRLIKLLQIPNQHRGPRRTVRASNPATLVMEKAAKLQRRARDIKREARRLAPIED